MSRAAVALAVLAMFAAACGGGSATERSTELRVFAAASLTESFTTLAHEFEKDHPAVRVDLNFGPSSGLAEQIDSGAPADVFASASTTTMDAVVAAGHAAGPEVFASNTMTVVVPPENPAGIRSLAELAGSEVKVALCQPQVPCGVAAREVLRDAGLDVRPATEETDVKSVLTKVQLGEVDAGIVYVTDAKAAGDRVGEVEVPAEVNASTRYPVAVLSGSEHRQAAREFVALLLSDRGAAVLASAGFAAP